MYISIYNTYIYIVFYNFLYKNTQKVKILYIFWFFVWIFFVKSKIFKTSNFYLVLCIRSIIHILYFLHFLYSYIFIFSYFYIFIYLYNYLLFIFYIFIYLLIIHLFNYLIIYCFIVSLFHCFIVNKTIMATWRY